MISGFFEPTSGRILFDDHDITTLPPHKRVAMGMARTFQITEIFPELSIRENLRIPVELAEGLRLRPWLSASAHARIGKRVDELIELGGLTRHADRLVGDLSHGDQRATEIIMSLALKPRLLLLDETTAGMGDQETYNITLLIRRLHRSQGLTMVLIEHDMRVIFHLADRIMVLTEGALLAEVGLTPARQGSIKIFGNTTTAWAPHRIAASGVGYVPEGQRIFANLTVEENLKVPLDRPGPWNIGRVYELFPRLAERRTNKRRQLSGGEQEMLAIARALLLDEPSQGLAPLIVRDVFNVIVSTRNEGMSILLVEQNVRAAVEIADRAYVLDDGQIAYSGSAAEFAMDEERVRALAGASAEKWDAME